MRRVLVLLVVVFVLVAALPAASQDAYCTLGQYVWGHETREFNDVPLPTLLDSLITASEPLTIGMPGRGVSFLDGSEPTITAGLTAFYMMRLVVLTFYGENRASSEVRAARSNQPIMTSQPP